MIPLSVGEVKSCLVVAVGRRPAWSLPPITHLPAPLLACSCQGSLREVSSQKHQYLKKSRVLPMGSEHKGSGHIPPFQLLPRMWQQHHGFQPSTGTAAICHCGQLAPSGAELLCAYCWGGGKSSWEQQPDPNKWCFSLAGDNEDEVRRGEVSDLTAGHSRGWARCGDPGLSTP